MNTKLRKYSVLILIAVFSFVINSYAQDNLEKAVNLIKKGDYVEARDILKNIVKDNNNYEPNYYYGYSLFKTGSIDEAEKFFKIALKDDDEGIGALKGLGELYSSQKKYIEANSQFRKALSVEPENISVMISQAKNFSLEGKIDDAIKVLTLATTYSKENPEVYVGLGDAYNIRGAYDIAIKYYNDAIKIKKNSAQAYFGLGQILFIQAKYDEAIKAYQSATESDPNFADSYLEFGKLLYFNGDYSAAADKFKTYTKLVPGSPEGDFNYGRTFYKQKKYDEAIGMFDAVLKVFPNFAPANRYSALSYIEKKDYSKAIELFGKIPEKEMEAVDYSNIAGAYSKIKNFDDAYKNYNKSISLDSSNANIYYEYAISQFDHEEYDKSIITMDIAFQKGFDQFTGYLYQGISNFYLKKYDYAVAKFQESIKLNNSFPFTYLWLCKSYVGLQKNTEAIAAYTKCLELDPNNEEAQRDLKSLQK